MFLVWHPHTLRRDEMRVDLLNIKARPDARLPAGIYLRPVARQVLLALNLWIIWWRQRITSLPDRDWSLRGMGATREWEREGRNDCVSSDEWGEMDRMRCAPGQTLPAVRFSPLLPSPKGKRRSEQAAAVSGGGSLQKQGAGWSWPPWSEHK